MLNFVHNHESMMRAIILAGGLGTRLQSIVSDRPKPMALIHQKPFLAYLIEYLSRCGITHVVLSVHFLYQKISAYFQNEYCGIAIDYSIDKKLLGTGGAIAAALTQVPRHQSVFVINGDSFVQLDYLRMWQQHEVARNHLTMAIQWVTQSTRYGTVTLLENTITEFHPKSHLSSAAFINTGVYLMQPNVFEAMSLPEQFSFELDFLAPRIKDLQARAFITDGYFIDIGVPSDYLRAVSEFV
jgi:D-glycero-alpha-D-manno-heptose 1-phosphate guanylyltransferase